MRPGQLTPNEFEIALLQHLAIKYPGVTAVIPKLHVLSRTFTGVGSWTNFVCEHVVAGVTEKVLGIEATISIPGLEHPLGAVFLFEGGKLKQIETYTFGEDKWDGVFEGFTIR